MSKAVHLVNTDLVNNLANLLNRATAASMLSRQRYPSFDVEVMEHVLKGTGETLALSLNGLAARVAGHYDKMLFHRGLEAIAEAAKNANAFFQLHAPWKMKEGPEKQTILFIICETARIANVLLQPIVPHYAQRSLTRLGLAAHETGLETAQLAGGPNIQMYGRPLGAETHILLKLQYEARSKMPLAEASDGPEETPLKRHAR